jgi:MarR family 2-MHQ and catechol resistance regulon transcriptional repressor
MINKIGETIRKARGNMTLVIDSLEKRGIVTRKNDPNDSKKRTVKITKSGLELIEKTFPYHSKIAYKILSVLEPKSQHSLSQLLKKLGKSNK